MKNLDNIEQVFRDSLSGLEADVNPEVWSNIQKNISSSGNSGSNGILGSLASKVLVGVLTTAAVITAVVVLNNSNEQTTPVNNKPVNVTENPVKGTNNNTTITTPKENKTLNNAPKSNNVNPVADGANKNATPDNTPPIVNNEPQITPVPNVNEPKQPNVEVPKIIVKAPVKPEVNTPELEVKKPSAQIVITPGNEYAPVVVTLSNQNNELDENVVWDFGDGTSPSMENTPIHIYEKPGKYIITLTVKDENGNVATDYETIEVAEGKGKNEKLKPYLPNSFTPNGDGINDVYQVSDDVNIATFKIVVTDKNGKPVAQWSDFEGYWDGRNVKGEICPPGTYIYIMDYTDKAGEKNRMSGTITLPTNR